MTGHETAEQRREIEQRAATVDVRTSPVDEIVELALLLLEPAHREDDAIDLLEAAVGREPLHPTAGLWLAYALLHVRMDAPSLVRAGEVIAPLLAVPASSGGAHLLLAEIGEEQGRGVDERIGLLEASVAREPDWVANRQDLAWAYSEAGRHDDAAAQLQHALTCVLPVDPAWGVARRSYEESITGRTAQGTEARLRSDLAQL